MTEPLRIVVGSDDAGFDYKEILKRDLEASAGVASVVDVGVAGYDIGVIGMWAAKAVDPLAFAGLTITAPAPGNGTTTRRANGGNGEGK